MDDFSRRIEKGRMLRKPRRRCGCCQEFNCKKESRQAARSRLKRDDAAVIRDETERDNDDTCD